MKNSPIVALAAITLFTTLAPLTGCGSDGSVTVTAPGTQATGLVKVSGKVIYRDGKPWIPHAFQQVAFVAPPLYIATGNAKPIFVTAAQTYAAQSSAPTEYTQMVQQGADCVRIQVAQTGIDPASKYVSPAFVQSVADAAKAARAAGLTVMLSDQDESQTGEPSESPLPSTDAQAAWTNLLTAAPWIGQDTGIMLEIYNEHYIMANEKEGIPSMSDWGQWQGAMNSLISTIRATGAINVLIADGLEHAEELSGAPTLNDIVSPVVYGSHPYAHNYQDQNAAGTDANGTSVPETGWNVKFGTFAASKPVIVTEWGNGYYCDNTTGTSDLKFLQYLQGLGVGLVATTWDWAGPNFGSVRVSFPANTTITSFPVAGTPICNAPAGSTDAVIDDGVGPGQLVQTWFTTGTPSTVLQ